MTNYEYSIIISKKKFKKKKNLNLIIINSSTKTKASVYKWIENLKFISFIIIIIEHLIFKISKLNCSISIHFHFIFSISRVRSLKISTKFLIQRLMMSTIFKKVLTFVWFIEINHFVIFLILLFSILISFFIWWVISSALILFMHNFNFLNARRNLTHSIFDRKWHFMNS